MPVLNKGPACRCARLVLVSEGSGSRDLQALSLVGEVGARGQAGDCALQAPQLLPGPPLARPRL